MKSHIVGLSLIAVVLFSGGCATKQDKVLEKKILTPESVEVYDVSANHVMQKANYGRVLLKDFPFVSYKPILDFRGKFSNQFYSKIDYRYKFAPLKNVDFWKLRTNPFMEDFIYVLPTWEHEFKKVSDDLFEDIGYSYNLSSKEQDILKWWIGQGGILWIEGGIYSTRYDTFKKNGEIDSRTIDNRIIRKSRNLKFFDRKVNTYIYKSKKIDYINYEPLDIVYKTKSNIPYFKDIKALEIKTDNFLTADFMPRGDYLLETTKGKPLVSFIRYGKGGVVFLRPFEFQNKRYDGELLRWKIMYYLMNKMYMRNNVIVQRSRVSINPESEIERRFKNTNTINMNNILFEYKSFELMPKSVTLLRPIAKYLKAHPSYKLKINGYTDNIGSKRYNYRLSSERAESVKYALVNMGIAPGRLITHGYGEDRPVATNNTKHGRALNRRIEFTIIKR